jgi:hemerythrin-like domain-containing protein
MKNTLTSCRKFKHEENNIMGIQIGAKPESSFAEPLGLLSDCHRRIEKFLRNLSVITQQAQGLALNPDQRGALETALRYFREAAPRHTRDEEDSLFPKLRALDDSRAQEALVLLDALETDHDVADAAHAAVDSLGQKWLEEDRLSPEETAHLGTTLESLQTLYQRHIAIEDTRLFPLAAQVLDDLTLKDVGREMAERRGIDLNAVLDLKLRCPTRRIA